MGPLAHAPTNELGVVFLFGASGARPGLRGDAVASGVS